MIRLLPADDNHDAFKAKLFELGSMPIPEDIQRLRDIVPEDEEDYQTIYAKNEGAVAAPTAGFHFSKSLMKRLELKGVEFAELTLHAGLGNFRDIAQNLGEDDLPTFGRKAVTHVTGDMYINEALPQIGGGDFLFQLNKGFIL